MNTKGKDQELNPILEGPLRNQKEGVKVLMTKKVQIKIIPFSLVKGGFPLRSRGESTRTRGFQMEILIL